MILSETDVAALTGYVRPSAQIRWLRRHGGRFVDRRPCDDLIGRIRPGVLRIVVL